MANNIYYTQSSKIVETNINDGTVKNRDALYNVQPVTLPPHLERIPAILLDEEVATYNAAYGGVDSLTCSDGVSMPTLPVPTVTPTPTIGSTPLPTLPIGPIGSTPTPTLP